MVLRVHVEEGIPIRQQDRGEHVVARGICVFIHPRRILGRAVTHVQLDLVHEHNIR